MKSYLEERIKYYDEEYRAGRALITDSQFDQLEKNLLRIDPNSDYFTEYILRNYIDVGEDELDVSKLSTVIRAKYGSISTAQEKLGTAQNIQKTFIDFQQYLYKKIEA